jgi:hypothetical protein
LRLAIEDAIEDVCADPEIGEAKIGDLAGIWVYKFKFNRQEYLMAYRRPAVTSRNKSSQGAQGADIELLMVDFYQVGSHERFYDELKRYLKAEG